MITRLQDFFEKPLGVGTILKGRYRLISFLGKGGYGLVYRASDLEENREVVVKQLRRRKLKEGITPFKREAELLNQLIHPSIPKCFDLFFEEKQHFLVMEYINGKNFEELIFLDGLQINERECFQIILNVLPIVKFLHENGVVHRDLRIPNIMVRDGQIVIIDFGLAASIDEAEDLQTFKSVEHRLYRQISYQTDFYTLGHFLLFLLYSCFEPKSVQDSSWEEELPLQPHSVKILRKMLQLDKAYESVDELVNEINEGIKY